MIQKNKISETGYKNAFKATALFGSVQIFIIIIKVAKSKLVALLLGTSGFGVMNLFFTATNLISSITNLGLHSSAVREIANAYGKNDELLLAKTVNAINFWVLITGIAGSLLTILFSPLISQILFNSSTYITSIIILSSIIILTNLWNQQSAILQGTSNINLLVKASIFGALASFVCSVPFFYFLREDGIAYALVFTVLPSTVVTYFYAKKVKIVKVKQTSKESFFLGLNAVKLGVAMSITGIVASFVEFVLKSYISFHGGVSDVGLYGAGWAINAQYLGLIFTAMAKDYYPRLSQSSSDNIRLNEMVNQQGEIAILILAPMIIVMVVFVSFFVSILYSKEFLASSEMIKWLLIGSLIKAGSWSISFVFLAKGDSKTFLFNELGINIVVLPAYILGYNFFGLVGLGYAFTFNYSVYFIWVAIVAFKKYAIRYTNSFWKSFIILLCAILIYPITALFSNNNYLTGSILIILITFYSLFELNVRLDFRNIINRIMNRYGLNKK